MKHLKTFSVIFLYLVSLICCAALLWFSMKTLIYYGPLYGIPTILVAIAALAVVATVVTEL